MSRSLQGLNPLQAARAIVAEPHKRFTASTLQILEICRELDRLDREPVPAISNELAEATRAFIAAHQAVREFGLFADGGALLITSNQTFRTFLAAFEQEFPNG